MNVRELRIGNLILLKKRNRQLHIGEKLLVWEGNEIIKVESHDIMYISNKMNEVEPIFLTEEWLVKFGFLDDSSIGIYYNYPLHINLDKGEIWYNGTDVSFDIDVKHVHQLQNLYFALTGEELTIKE